MSQEDTTVRHTPLPAPLSEEEREACKDENEARLKKRQRDIFDHTFREGSRFRDW